jgi:hypothetical protein
MVSDNLDAIMIAQRSHDLHTQGHSRASGLPATCHLPPTRHG